MSGRRRLIPVRSPQRHVLRTGSVERARRVLCAPAGAAETIPGEWAYFGTNRRVGRQFEVFAMTGFLMRERLLSGALPVDTTRSRTTQPELR